MSYFTKSKEPSMFQCNICFEEKCKKTTISGSRINSAGLRGHVGKEHGLTEFLFESQRAGRKLNKSKIEPGLKKKLNEFAIQAVVIDNLPFGVFRKEGMKKFINACHPGYVGPLRKTVRCHLTQLYFNVKDLFIKFLRTLSKVAFTSDLWKSATNHHYITLTLHFQSDKAELFLKTEKTEQFSKRKLLQRFGKKK